MIVNSETNATNKDAKAKRSNETSNEHGIKSQNKW